MCARRCKVGNVWHSVKQWYIRYKTVQNSEKECTIRMLLFMGTVWKADVKLLTKKRANNILPHVPHQIHLTNQ